MVTANKINFKPVAYQKMIEAFSKNLTRTQVGMATSNLYGEEVLTDGTVSTIRGTFFKREDAYMQDKQGLMKNADAIIMILPTIELKRDDKISFSGETFRVDEVEDRYLGDTIYYKMARLYLI